jgi:hypothetical protein
LHQYVDCPCLWYSPVHMPLGQARQIQPTTEQCGDMLLAAQAHR